MAFKSLSDLRERFKWLETISIVRFVFACYSLQHHVTLNVISFIISNLNRVVSLNTILFYLQISHLIFTNPTSINLCVSNSTPGPLLNLSLYEEGVYRYGVRTRYRAMKTCVERNLELTNDFTLASPLPMPVNNRDDWYGSIPPDFRNLMSLGLLSHSIALDASKYLDKQQNSCLAA